MAFNPVLAFLQEADELIADIEASALALTSDAAPAETVNRLFRGFHTIKGSGAMCGLDRVAEFTHHVESFLQEVRDGAIPVSPSLAELVLKCADHIKFLLNAAQSGQPAPPEAGEALVAAIRDFGNAPAAPPSADAVVPAQTWRINFHPNPALLRIGGSPVALLRELSKLGPCEITAHDDEVPPLPALRTDLCYFWWSIVLHTAADRDAIRDVFIFVEDGSRLEIECSAPVPPAPPASHPPAAQPSHNSPAAPLIKEAVVRVPAERLDRLVNLVGEFVMTHSCLAQAAAQRGAPEFAGPVQVLERLVAELRDTVLGIRMLPVGTLFGRFRRVVHDLSSELGKQADLVTEGDETELDKSILDQLSEPLVHGLRNCVDHGIEPPADRLRLGKPPRATIRLSAAHTGSNVVIRVQDDGRGIDRAAVLAKAIERQLVPAGATLSDQDILNLILLPGFSTARQVTSVSGRGVGMDVVKRQIDLLRGSLSLESTAGKGTCVSVTLPLTLAIIDGLLVQVGGERFILPMSSVAENVELNRDEKARHNGRNVLAVRGGLLPYIDLRRTFQIQGDAPAVEKVVIVQHQDERVGLVADRVLGTHQTVIQSLGKFYKNVDVFSGATIMGDGRVTLILDTDRLVQFVYSSQAVQKEIRK